MHKTVSYNKNDDRQAMDSLSDKNYTKQFDDILQLINQARNNVIRIANTAMIELYWNIGEYLHEKITSSEWGSGVWG